jgi:hypothetical protein
MLLKLYFFIAQYLFLIKALQKTNLINDIMWCLNFFKSFKINTF